MQNRAIFLESKRLEQQLINFQLEGALLEVMKDKFIVKAMLAEQRKIEKYALQIGLVNKNQINEGFLADVVLGAGQMLGNWASIVGVPLGSAFGVAGVLWYGNEMLSTAPGSFDFFMNLIFCLFSAAAVPDPTPASGTASTLAKTIIAPFAKLGNAARALGNGVIDAGKALAWVKSSGPAAALAVESAVKAEPALVKAAPWIERTIAGAGEVMTSIAAKVKNLPGGSKFTAMIETVTKYAGQAWKFIKGCIESLINVGKSAAGKALGTTAAADASLAAARAGGSHTAAIATRNAALGTFDDAARYASQQLLRLSNNASGKSLGALIAKTPGGAEGVLRALARKDPTALRAIANATKQTPGLLPNYLVNGIIGLNKSSARVLQSQGRVIKAGASSAAAQTAAQKAAATAAARIAAAAKTNVARLGANAVNAAGSSQTQ